ncbi:MAG: hypothetical protein FOGNACKC_01907 [Anaerolineae bacterium]|nr:hypothetical protein [Anaerolineae bacterium]
MFTAIGITLTVAVMVFATAFYVAAEFASVSARKTRIMQLAHNGNFTAKILLPIIDDNVALDRYVATSQVGISISSLVLGAYGQNTVAPALSPLLLRLGLPQLTQPLALSISVTGVLIFLTVLQVIVGELLPKSLTLQYPEQVALATAMPMTWSAALFRPLIWFFNGSANLLIHLFGVNRATETHAHSPEEIELLVSESHLGGLLDDDSRQMLRNALRLRQLTARQVMVPRNRVVAAPISSTVDDLINLACAEGYSRIPLYQDTIDNIVAHVHLKDMFRLQLNGQQDPKLALRKAVFVPEGAHVDTVWADLNQKHKYMAIVLDEYGGTAGLLTIEDLVEEIVGELLDEFDDELPLVSADKNGRLHLRGDLLITDVNEYLGVNFPNHDNDTLGGLVFDAIGHAARVGDEVAVGSPAIPVRVEAMDGLQILEISLKLGAGGLPQVNEWKVPGRD